MSFPDPTTAVYSTNPRQIHHASNMYHPHQQQQHVIEHNYTHPQQQNHIVNHPQYITQPTYPNHPQQYVNQTTSYPQQAIQPQHQPHPQHPMHPQQHGHQHHASQSRQPAQPRQSSQPPQHPQPLQHPQHPQHPQHSQHPPHSQHPQHSQHAQQQQPALQNHQIYYNQPQQHQHQYQYHEVQTHPQLQVPSQQQTVHHLPPSHHQQAQTYYNNAIPQHPPHSEYNGGHLMNQPQQPQPQPMQRSAPRKNYFVTPPQQQPFPPSANTQWINQAQQAPNNQHRHFNGHRKFNPHQITRPPSLQQGTPSVTATNNDLTNSSSDTQTHNTQNDMLSNESFNQKEMVNINVADHQSSMVHHANNNHNAYFDENDGMFMPAIGPHIDTNDNHDNAVNVKEEVMAENSGGSSLENDHSRLHINGEHIEPFIPMATGENIFKSVPKFDIRKPLQPQTYQNEP
eukprot:84062_1